MREALIGVAMTVGLAFVASLAVSVPLVLHVLRTRGEVAEVPRVHPGGLVPGCNPQPYRGQTIAGTDVRWLIELAKEREALDELERTGRLPW